MMKGHSSGGGSPWLKVAIVALVLLFMLDFALFRPSASNQKSFSASGDESNEARYRVEAHNRKGLPSFKVKRPNWGSIKRLPVSDSQVTSKQWVVVTSINYPTEAIEKLAQLDGWKVVVVGDTKSPSDWKLDNCVFLSVEKQRQLEYAVHEVIPYRHYGRKNIGYVYAIQHGAETIYETDDDNVLTVDNIADAFITGSPKPVLAYDTSEKCVNPYRYFGEPSIWPRGYPLSKIGRPDVITFKSGNEKPLIQQGLANGDPDVDAIFRLTRKVDDRKIEVSFDNDAKPVVLPEGVMCPFNSQNTLFHYDALWGLMIPVTVPFRVCDIWRGYWAQRLVWEVGGNLAFLRPTVYQDRNPHDYLIDFEDELQMYEQAWEFIEFLTEWRPQSSSDHFFDRVLDLSESLVQAGFWDPGDAELTSAYLQDLIAVGYKPPTPTNSKMFSGSRVTIKAKSPDTSDRLWDPAYTS